MGRRSTTDGVKPMGDRIEVRFTWMGQELRPTLPLKPTAANLAHAKRQRRDILDEIRAGTFDLRRHFPTYKFAARHETKLDGSGRTFREWAELWKKLAARELEYSTLHVYWTHLSAYWMPAFGGMFPRQITHEMVLTRLADLASDRFDEQTGETIEGLSRKTQNNILIPLRAVFALACKGPHAPPSPTDGIKCLKVQTGNPDPFTAEEVEAILTDLRKPRLHTTVAQSAALADYFEFAFFAGLRPSEQIAVLWGDVDLRSKTITIRRSRVLKQEKDRTKTHRSRTVELNDRAAAVIERQRARTQLAGGKVFMNPWTGKAWNNGEEQRRDWMACLKRISVRHRPPKECRDASVTMALQAGADPYYVAAQHGHSLQTMMRDYAAFIPKGDRGRNLAALNAVLGNAGNKTDFAVGAQ